MNPFHLKTLRRTARILAASARAADPAAVVPVEFQAGAVRIRGRLYPDEAASVGRAMVRAVRWPRRRKPAKKKGGR